MFFSTRRVVLMQPPLAEQVPPPPQRRDDEGGGGGEEDGGDEDEQEEPENPNHDAVYAVVMQRVEVAHMQLLGGEKEDECDWDMERFIIKVPCSEATAASEVGMLFGLCDESKPHQVLQEGAREWYEKSFENLMEFGEVHIMTWVQGSGVRVRRNAALNKRQGTRGALPDLVLRVGDPVQLPVLGLVPGAHAVLQNKKAVYGVIAGVSVILPQNRAKIQLVEEQVDDEILQRHLPTVVIFVGSPCFRVTGIGHNLAVLVRSALFSHTMPCYLVLTCVLCTTDSVGRRRSGRPRQVGDSRGPRHRHLRSVLEAVQHPREQSGSWFLSDCNVGVGKDGQ